MKFRAITIFIIILTMVCIVAMVFMGISYYRYTSQGAVLRYLRDHKQDVAIACFDPTQPEAGFYHQAEDAYPLASTFKVVLLAAYAQEVAAGRLDPQEQVPLSALDAYYLPGTDAGAHPQFLQSLGEGQTTVTLAETIDGMMVYSSNAAADYIYSRVGNVSFADLYQRLGLTQTSQPFTYLGLYLFMTNHETGHYAEEDLTPEEIQAEKNRLETLYLTDPTWRSAEISYANLETSRPNVAIQRSVTDVLGMKGSARDMTRLMLAAYGYTDALSPEAQTVMRQHLEWPSRLNPENAKTFTALAAKSGSWPNVLTSVWYSQTKSGEKLALSVLYRNMPEDFWSSWVVSFSQQLLEVEVLTQGDCALLAEALQ